MISNNQSIVVTAGYRCNSNCEMCVVGSKNKKNDNASTQEVMEILVEGRKNQIDRVEISGGEPTVRKDLVELISFAKKIGYKIIGISTNGMALNDEYYCKELITAGINIFTVSLHAPNQKINEIITNTPNSFKKTIAGIKNIIKHNDANLCVVTVVQKSNYQHLTEIGNLISSLGVKQWNIVDLSPKGISKDIYSTLCVNRIELADALIKTITSFSNLKILLYNFTHCTIPREYHKYMVTHINKCNKNKHISYSKKQEFKQPIVNDGSDDTLTKIDSCKNCIYSEKCAGFWSDYISLYGENEIAKLARINNCINTK